MCDSPRKHANQTTEFRAQTLLCSPFFVTLIFIWFKYFEDVAVWKLTEELGIY